MAQMHPVDLNNYKATESEKKFYYALKEQLPDTFHVFYSVRWYETNGSGERENSECDFLVFDPGFGFLAIEVKGGLRIDLENGNWIITERNEFGEVSTRQLKKSPFIQAENSMRYFYNYFAEEFIQTFRGVYGFCVCFPMYMIDNKIESSADPHIVIDIRDFNNLKFKINEIFHYWRVKRNNQIPFSSDQKSKFINLVNKRISLSAAAGALIPIKEMEIEKINLVQDSIIDFLSNYKQAQIVGGAGTGKTFMAIKKAKRLNSGANDILITCKSKELSDFIKGFFLNCDRVDCFDYFTLMDSVFGIKLSKGETYFDKIYDVDKEYDAIIVDEAQDFGIEEALSLKALLKDENKSYLYIFFDENQNLFNVNFNGTFSFDSRPYILRYNIRNTGSIYAYATKKSGLGIDTIANNLVGVEPETIPCKNKIQVLNNITRIVNRLVQKESVKTSSIVVLTDVDFNRSCMYGENNLGEYKICYNRCEIDEKSILFQSVSEFKGLESDIVIYLKDKAGKEVDIETKRRIDYVAYTRARYYLYVIEM